jgi:hypothetical protein
MDTDQYSLDNLRDIVIPDPPLFWPPAPGVWVALGIIVVIALFIGWRLHESRKRNAYRKAGLALMDNVRTSYDVSVVLKRVALAAFPREQVASLYGDDWVAFLHKTCPRSYFSVMVASDAGTPPDAELVELAGTWIRHHQVPESKPAVAVI